MQIINSLLKKNKRHELFLSVIFFAYLLFNVQTPEPISKLINNIIGLVAIVISAIYLLINTNPILGILGVLVAYELLRRSETDVFEIRAQQPSEKKKQQFYSKFNKVPVSLEEEHVRKVAPHIRTTRIGDGNPNKKIRQNSNKFQPVLGNSVLNPLPVRK
jgi:hypothetical protein